MAKVLVVAVHPDDETLGAGGTLLKHKKKGDEIFWCIVTEMKEELGFSKSDILRRQEEIKKIQEMYDFSEVFNLKFPTMKLTEIPLGTLIESFSNVLSKLKPDILYVPFPWDAHSDHRRTFEALHPFLKSFRYPFLKRVLAMEVISETDYPFSGKTFSPNVWIDISEFIEEKIRIMKVYQSELGKHPFPRSLENIKVLALYRGSQCNCKYAESFMLLKEVVL